MSIVQLQHHGVLIDECLHEGEGRIDDTVPAHPNGIQASADKWLLVYATRRWRGNDDDCSIFYQLRDQKPDGRLIKEGALALTSDDWHPEGLNPNRTYKKMHRIPGAFGVPKGAMINGKPAPNANLFVIKWQRAARVFHPDTNVVNGTDTEIDPEMVSLTNATEWTQVRLNEAEDDLEIVRPVEIFRQKGYETGPSICSLEDAKFTVSSIQQAVPYNDDCTEWVENGWIDNYLFRARKYRYNPEAGRYEWVETGPSIFPPHEHYGGGHLVRWKKGWAAVRTNMYIDGHFWHGRGLTWTRLEDPFVAPKEYFDPPEPETRTPANPYYCPDGVLRYFGGEGPKSPYKNERDPLYCWDIDPENGFMPSNGRVVYDTVKAGLPIRREARPLVGMCKLLPHYGQRQHLVHRVQVTSRLTEHIHGEPEPWSFPPINEQEKAACAVYYATIDYDEVEPPPWSFS